LEEAMRNDKYLCEQKKVRPTFQKACDDKKKRKMDQRKKGFNFPFVRNSYQAYQQGKQAQDETKMTDSSVKMSRMCVGDVRETTHINIVLTGEIG
jgi:hypothetical protein